MTVDPNQIISAQLVIRSASGKSTKGEAITTNNIADFLPSAAVASGVVALLRKLGFQVGNVVGNSVSITAPVRTFEKVFRAGREPASNSLALFSPVDLRRAGEKTAPSTHQSGLNR